MSAVRRRVLTCSPSLRLCGGSRAGKSVDSSAHLEHDTCVDFAVLTAETLLEHASEDWGGEKSQVKLKSGPGSYVVLLMDAGMARTYLLPPVNEIYESLIAQPSLPSQLLSPRLSYKYLHCARVDVDLVSSRLLRNLWHLRQPQPVPVPAQSCRHGPEKALEMKRVRSDSTHQDGVHEASRISKPSLTNHHEHLLKLPRRVLLALSGKALLAAHFFFTFGPVIWSRSTAKTHLRIERLV